MTGLAREPRRTALSSSAGVRLLGVAALLAGLWLAVAWAVAVP